MTPQPGPSRVMDVVNARLAELPAAERRVAQALLARYPTAGLGSAHQLAELAGASTPTVVRFVARMGFDGYRAFQQALRDEVQRDRTASPRELRRQAGATCSPPRSVSELAHSLEETIAALAQDEVWRAVDLLTDEQSRLICAGGRFSHVLASYLELHLRQLRPRTDATNCAALLRDARLLDLGTRDTLVLFDFRRYEKDAKRVADRVRRQGARLLLVTDPWLSPAAECADVVLSVAVAGPSPFDTQVPATAVVEMLVAGLLDRLGMRADERMRAFDELSNESLFE